MIHSCCLFDWTMIMSIEVIVFQNNRGVQQVTVLQVKLKLVTLKQVTVVLVKEKYPFLDANILLIHPVNLVESRDLVHILQAVLYFTDQHLSPFYRLFCKIASLSDFSDFNVDNPAKFCEASMSRSCISRKQAI